MEDYDFCEIYDLETYLFSTVYGRFRDSGALSPFDLVCILSWKANRSKWKVLKRICDQAGSADDVDEAVRVFRNALIDQNTSEGRLRVVMKDFMLPIANASAILSVLYPDQFTVYDVRVCNALGDFHDVKNKTKFESIWGRYKDYKQAVDKIGDDDWSLRDKDRYLWGKSFAKQINYDLSRKAWS